MRALSAILQHMQEYAKYAAIAGPTVAEYGGEFLARGGDATQVVMVNVRHYRSLCLLFEPLNVCQCIA